jgi:hypothetical protein
VLSDAAGEFTDFVVVPADGEGTYRVAGEAAALAVYELTGAAPAGYTVDGITYRERVAGDRLVAAAIGQPGEGELSLDLEVPDGALRSASFCSGAPRGTWVHLEIEGHGLVEGAGCGDTTFDPGAHGGAGYPDGVSAEPGETVAVRLWLTDGPRGPRVSPDGVRLGVGFYEDGRPAARWAGWDVPEYYERDGHTWRYADGAESRPGSRTLELVDATDAPSLVVFFADRTGGATIRSTYDGKATDDLYSTGAGSGIVGLTPPGKAPLGLVLRGDVGPRARVGLAVYERID